MTTAKTNSKPRAPRKPKVKLPPAIAHEADILRAARIGIDISHMGPDERCKYPSRFCCNKRARKTTGKLHRFCEDHRSRANVNQKRWTEIRRRQESAQNIINISLALCQDESWKSACLPHSVPVEIASSTPPKPADWEVNSQPPSPTNVDTQVDDLPLSEDDIDTLTSIVALSERSVEAMTMEDAWLMTMIQEVEAPVVTAAIFEELAIGTL
jgi:hypothetical protein